MLKVASRLFRIKGKMSVSSCRVPVKQSLTRRSASLREYSRCSKGSSLAFSHSCESPYLFVSIAFFNSSHPFPSSSGYLQSFPSLSSSSTALQMSVIAYLSPTLCFSSPLSPAKFPVKQSLTFRCATTQEYLRNPSELTLASSHSLITSALRLSIAAFKFSLPGNSLGYFST